MVLCLQLVLEYHLDQEVPGEGGGERRGGRREGREGEGGEGEGGEGEGGGGEGPSLSPSPPF